MPDSGVDPDLIREWAAMLEGIAEEMKRVADVADPPDFVPNVLAATQVSYGVSTEVLTHEEFIAVRAGVMWIDSRGRVLTSQGEAKRTGQLKVITPPPDERADVTIHIYASKNTEHLMREIRKDLDRGKVVHLCYPEQDNMRVRVL